ncbi:MAG: N-acetylmuramoyl-L-alanine amidase [Actinomycetota bacterium]
MSPPQSPLRSVMPTGRPARRDRVRRLLTATAAAATAALTVALTACSGGAGTATASTTPGGTVASGGTAPGGATPASGPAVSIPGQPTAGSASSPAAGGGRTTPPASAGTATGAPGTSTPQDGTARPLAGQTVGIDPGHNGGNAGDPAFLAHQIWNGRALEDCDTTGTETDGGYTEATFNFRVATFLRRDLRRDGARVVMTRTSNTGVGPCVDRRARIINHAHADVAVDIHGDGGPASGRGFAILEPARDGPNDHVIGSSQRFARALHRSFLAATAMPTSTYDGVNGFTHRDDLAGLNLTTVPKVLIECGNMRNAADAALMTSTRFQRRAARAMEQAIVAFLGQH